MPKLLVLFPGALGDFVCLLPTLATLRHRFKDRMTVAAKPSLLDLLPDEIDRFSIDRAEVADLFGRAAPHDTTRALLAGFTHVQSWTGHSHAGFADRVRSVSHAQVAVHAFRAMRAGEHAVQYYARCAGVTPRTWPLWVPATAREWAATLLQEHERPTTLMIHAGSGSASKNWNGFPALAKEWRRHGRVIWLIGPADDTPPRDVAADLIHDQPLCRIAALLQQAPLYVGNDSGISHLAGLAGARGMTLFGASDPVVWRPLGLHVLRGAPPSTACADSCFCTRRLSVELTHTALQLLCESAA